MHRRSSRGRRAAQTRAEPSWWLRGPDAGPNLGAVSADTGHVEPEPGLYARLGVEPDADLDALRSAYRSLARRLHPDLQQADGPDTQLAMAAVNEAWEVLSDPLRRERYDLERRRRLQEAEAAARARSARGPAAVLRPEQPEAVRFVVTRKDAWLAAMAMRIRFLAGYAGRSAAQAMLLRHPGTARDAWEALVPLICGQLVLDVGERIRSARACGAAPLDLANAASLIGLHVYGEQLVAGSTGLGWDDRLRHAEMVDRMYETLAYELPRELVQALGSSPRVVRRLNRGR